MAAEQPPAPAEGSRSVATRVGWAILVVALIIAASTGSALLAYLLFNRAVPAAPVRPERVEVRQTGAERAAEAAGVPPLGPTLEIGEFVVNLAPGPGLTVRYARVGVVVEGDRPEVVEQLRRRDPQVRDLIIGHLRTKRVDELATREGLDQVRRELAESLSRLVSRGKVVNVYFTDFVIQ